MSSPNRLDAQPVPSPSLEDAVIALTDEVRGLSQQVEVLRIAIDDIRQELEFAIRNFPREPWVPTQLVVSLPRDPLADPFPVNRTRREDLPAESTVPFPTPQPPTTALVAGEPPAPSKKKRRKAGELF